MVAADQKLRRGEQTVWMDGLQNLARDRRIVLGKLGYMPILQVDMYLQDSGRIYDGSPFQDLVLPAQPAGTQSVFLLPVSRLKIRTMTATTIKM